MGITSDLVAAMADGIGEFVYLTSAYVLTVAANSAGSRTSRTRPPSTRSCATYRQNHRPEQAPCVRTQALQTTHPRLPSPERDALHPARPNPGVSQQPPFRAAQNPHGVQTSTNACTPRQLLSGPSITAYHFAYQFVWFVLPIRPSFLHLPSFDQTEHRRRHTR